MANGFEVLESSDPLDACDLVVDRPAPAMAVVDAPSAADDGLRQLARLGEVPLVRTVGDGPGLSPYPTTLAEAVDLLHHSNRRPLDSEPSQENRPVSPPQ